MKLENKQVMIDAVKNADLVLIGIGEEWGVSFDEMLKEQSFAENYEKLTDEDQKNRFVPLLQREYLKDIHDETLKDAYDNLLKLVQNKNYFLVSMNKDRYPVMNGFQKEKCVFPCGGYELLQCDDGCEENLMDAPSLLDENFKMINQQKQISGIEMPRCPVCGKEMVFNNIEAAGYLEKGYLEDWKYYMKWLQGTVNKRLCLLELGVSLRFPSVIRWPFEKTTFYNQKAEMFRIHHSLSQSTENISDRCYSHSENSVAYLSNLFVS